jgi:hypothetical protein
MYISGNGLLNVPTVLIPTYVIRACFLSACPDLSMMMAVIPLLSKCKVALIMIQRDVLSQNTNV